MQAEIRYIFQFTNWLQAKARFEEIEKAIGDRKDYCLNLLPLRNIGDVGYIGFNLGGNSDSYGNTLDHMRKNLFGGKYE